jgi:hypothetical protein
MELKSRPRKTSSKQAGSKREKGGELEQEHPVYHLLHAGFLLGIPFSHEDGCDMFP